MPRVKKPRNKGVTYKLVPRSYGDADGADQGPLWVSETEFYRQHQGSAPANDDDTVRRQFNLYAVAANAEFDDERCRYSAVEYGGEVGCADDATEVHAQKREWANERDDGEGEWDDEYEEEEEGEGEGVDDDWEDRGEDETPHLQAPKSKAAPALASAAPPALVGSCSLAPATRLSGERGDRNSVSGEEEEEVEKLFDDEVECEVTDDFLRQLVFGSCDNGGGKEGGSDVMMDDGIDDDWNGLDEEDGELWRLLTEDEKAAIKAAHQRGTARRRRVVAPVDSAEGGPSRTHAADGTEYPAHDTTQRALDRQFTEMMREFDADARLNDAYTDDPRTHGALPMDNYLTALEEFLLSRAGIDVETAEPHRNKGLIQQIKYLSHHVGAFDSDARGVYRTTVLPEKHQRFAEEFQKGTEEIRRAARMRVARRNAAAASASASSSPEKPAVRSPTPEKDSTAEKEEELVVMEVKPKAYQLDCETAVSMCSTYYNQPNVIQAPRHSAQARRARKASVSRRGGEATGGEAERSADHRSGDGDGTSGTAVVKGNLLSSGATPSSSSSSNAAAATINGSAKRECKRVQVREPTSDSDSEDRAKSPRVRDCADFVLTVRRKDETKEEKKMRRQAVKAAQRERRQAKSALKHTYKEVESEEVKRSAASQAARRTVHFL
ncbi:hypothetical protein LSCM1_04434 [Leishmania martiniquensis]|uniref:Uncharacterized protein n=1 Tax=Leishmania martiniquensis TaxID=1580590 RepID=A0A836GHJ6_9TRYP|nr:hypothetical protein LSCM1_04434 [Leishmania martiniquensis]